MARRCGCASAGFCTCSVTGDGVSGTGSVSDPYVIDSGTAAADAAAEAIADTGLETPWAAYTPTYTNITLGTGGSVSGAYKELGHTTFFRAAVILGTGGSVAAGSTIGLPNAAVGSSPLAAYLADDSAGLVIAASALTVVAAVWIVGPAGRIGATSPWTWAALDSIRVAGVYDNT